MSQTFNHVKIGIHNRLFILNHVRLNPGITRAKLAKDCGLTAATVSNVIDRLLEAGYVKDCENNRKNDAKQGLGRPSSPLRINAQRLYTVGLSCDLSQLQGCIVNLNGDVIASDERQLKAETPAAYIHGLYELYEDLCQEVALPNTPVAVGLAAMGPLQMAEGKIYLHSPCNEWKDYHFVDELRSRIGLPVMLEKNSTAAALYELWNGNAQKFDSILYIYLGHGVGGALILHNEIYRGTFSNAGEVGHINVIPGGKPCLCGARGCLESYLSLDALQKILPFFETNPQLESFYQSKEPHFMDWLEQAAELLGRAVGSIINLLDISSVMLSGLFPNSILQFFREYLEQNVARYVMNGKTGELSFLLSRQENQPSLGAALLPICELLSSGLTRLNLSPLQERML